MSVSMAQRSESLMDEQQWTTIFPNFATLEGSCMFVKKLIAVSLSSITYLRGIFPEEAYGERELCGLRLKLLTETSGIKAVSQFIDIIRSCYDAVDKKYLQQIRVGICVNPENRNEVIEEYNLVFRYKDDECSISYDDQVNVFSSKNGEATVKACYLMLQNIYKLSSLLEALPKKAFINFKLLYYDDVTPMDYEPTGFEPTDQVKFNFQCKTVNIDFGSVDTNNHGLQFRMKSTMNKLSLSQPRTTENDLSISRASLASTTRNNNIEKNHSSQDSQTNHVEKPSSPLHAVKCPCRCKPTDEWELIRCASCENHQHKVCYGILDGESPPSVFYCVACIVLNTDDKTYDPVYWLQGKECQEFCVMRQALILCSNLVSVTQRQLELALGCTTVFAGILIKRLVKEGFLKRQPGRDKYTVNERNVTCLGLPEYFPSKENKENDEEIFIDDQEELNGEVSPIMNSPTQNKGSASLLQPSQVENANIELSIRKVRDFKISSPATKSTSGTSRKRKASKKIMENDSAEIFQSQKRHRVTKGNKGKK